MPGGPKIIDFRQARAVGLIETDKIIQNNFIKIICIIIFFEKNYPCLYLNLRIQIPQYHGGSVQPRYAG